MPRISSCGSSDPQLKASQDSAWNESRVLSRAYRPQLFRHRIDPYAALATDAGMIERTENITFIPLVVTLCFFAFRYVRQDIPRPKIDRQTGAMFRQADALAAQAQAGPLTAAATNLPPGSQSYSFISTLSSNGVCSQSVEITSQGDGVPPRIVRHRSGNCAVTPGGRGTVNLPMAPATRPDVIWTNARPATPNAAPAAPASKPDVIWTSAKGDGPYSGLVREIPAAQR